MSYRDDFREGQSNFYWTLPKVVGGVIAFLIVIYAIGFLTTGGDLAIYSFWAPKQANAENRVFHETQAFTDGKIQNIGQECFAYNAAEGDQKTAFASEIRNEAATIDINKLPPDEKSCVMQARGN